MAGKTWSLPSLSPKGVAFLYFSCSTVGGGQWGPPFEQVEGAPPCSNRVLPSEGVRPALYGLLAAAPVPSGSLRCTWSEAEGASCVVQGPRPVPRPECHGLFARHRRGGSHSWSS